MSTVDWVQIYVSRYYKGGSKNCLKHTQKNNFEIGNFGKVLEDLGTHFSGVDEKIKHCMVPKYDFDLNYEVVIICLFNQIRTKKESIHKCEIQMNLR